MHTYIYIYMFLCWCVGLSIFHMSLSLNLGFTQYILPRYLLYYSITYNISIVSSKHRRNFRV